MKKYIFPLILLFPVLLAAQPATGTQILTITQAMQMGVSNSKQLRLDSAKLAASAIKEQEVGDNALPNVSVNAGYTRLSNITPVTFQFPGNPEPVTLLPNIPNTYMLSAGVRQPVFTGWKLKYSQESYSYLTKATALDADKDRSEIRLNIISAYIGYVKLELSQKIIADNLKAADQRVDETKSMRDRGLATDNDVLKAQLYRSNLALSQTEVESSVSVAEYSLCILLGLPEGTHIEADTTGLFAAITLAPESKYEQDALSGRSETKALGLRTQAAESGLKLAHSGYYPTLSLGADYLDARPNQRIFPLVDEFKQTWDVGLTLSWNLTSLYTTKHAVADAQVQLLQAQIQSGQLNDGIRTEVFGAYSACNTALSKMQTLQLAVQQAAENNRQVKARYDQQAALMSDVLDADAALLQARINIVLQRADEQLAYYKLLKAAGQLN